MDFSTFPLLCERVYSDLEAEEPRLRRQLPFAGFQHVCTGILNAHLIDHVRTVNSEDRYVDEESPLNLIPDDMVLPGPISEYLKAIANTTTPQEDLVKVNVPDCGILQPPYDREDDQDGIPSESFGPIEAEDHNKYECYVSPYVTSRLVERTRDQQLGD